jgi:RNA polymerase sigma-70 factor, ECF subfamily
LRLTVGATFDGVDIVDPKSVPIATDEWLAEYPPRAMGGCAVSATGPATGVGAWLVAASLAAVSIAKRGHEKSRARPTIQWRRFFSPLAEPKIRAHITVVLSASQMPAIRRPQLHLASRTSETYPEDQELAEALIGGQSWAATATYQKHGSMVYRFLHRTLGTSEEAEDMTQEVFLQVFSNVRTLRNPQALRSFIFSVAIRTLKWELRRRRIRRFFHVSDFDQVPEPAVSALDAESRQAVRRLYAILDRLTAQERAAFVLRHVEQLKLEEVAQALEVSLATVKRRLERAVRIVSREMEQDPSLAPYSKRMTYDKHGRGQNEAS